MRKYCKALVNIAVTAVTLLAVILLLPRALVFFAPFVVGWVVSLIAAPLVRFFEEKVKIRRKVGSVVVIVVVIALVVLLIYFILARLIDQVIGLVGALPDMWAGIESDLQHIGNNMSVILNRLPADVQTGINDFLSTIGSYLGDFFGRISTPTITAAGNFAKMLPSLFIGIIMALLSAYFFVAEKAQIGEWFCKHTPVAIQIPYRMMRNSFVKSVGGYFKAQLKIEVWMYFLLFIGLAILRVDYFVLIALVIAMLDFVPFLGTGTVLIPWAVLRIFSGDYKVAIGLLIIWGVGQLARQLIQPKIVGDSLGVAPVPTLFLLYIGYKVGGVIGMIVAVPIGLLFYSMYEGGAFDTAKNSALILIAGVNRFRRLNKADMFEVEEMKLRNEETAREVEQQREEALREREEHKKSKKNNTN